MKTRLGLIAVHSIRAMAGGTLLAFVAYIAVRIVVSSVTTFRTVQVDAWYGPVVWGPALLLGFLLRRRLHQREACLVWLAGLAWLAVGLHDVKSFDHAWPRVRIDLFPAKQAECSRTECLYVLFYTIPVVCSLAYSLGAYLEGRRTRRR
jgi:hypothetical protein